jgi:hypothetical protein
VPDDCVVVNAAVTLLAVLMVRVQIVAVPEHAPLQPEKVEPDAGDAVSVTLVPEAYDSEQPVPQLMPVPVTVPEPLLVTVSV